MNMWIEDAVRMRLNLLILKAREKCGRGDSWTVGIKEWGRGRYTADTSKEYDER